MLPEIRFHLGRLLARTRRMLASVGGRGWRATFRALLRHGTPVSRAIVDSPRSPAGDGPLLLVVDSEIPRPDRDSGSFRLFNLMRLLLEDGFRVAFIADDGHVEDQDSRALRSAGVEVVSESAPAWLRRHGVRVHGAILCRHLVAGHWLPLVRRMAPRAHVVFDTVDLHHLRELRQAQVQGTRSLLRRAMATRAAELGLASRADTTWVVSDDERIALSSVAPRARIIVVSNTFEKVVQGKGYAEREDLLFIGGHRHPPNTDAAWWLLREIYPRIRQRLPGVRLHLAGPDVPDALRIAAAATEGVILHGHVPDLEPLLLGCRLAIVPLRFGAGVKGKINLSMAHGQPVVTTSCGAEGMRLRAGVDVVVADDAEALADATERVYRDSALWHAMAENGRENVRRYFSFDATRVALRQTFEPRS